MNMLSGAEAARLGGVQGSSSSVSSSFSGLYTSNSFLLAKTQRRLVTRVQVGRVPRARDAT